MFTDKHWKVVLNLSNADKCLRDVVTRKAVMQLLCGKCFSVERLRSVDWDLNFVVVRELHCDRTAVSTVIIIIIIIITIFIYCNWVVTR